MKNVVLLYGGRSFEHDVSVITAIEVGQWFPERYKVYPVYMRDGEWWMVKDWTRFDSYTSLKGRKVRLDHEGLHVGVKTIPVDCVLLCSHGGEGEDGTLQVLLEWWGLPYTSCDPLVSGLMMDKCLSKRVLASYGFPVVEEVQADEEPTLPVIVKPARLGSSIGVGVARTMDEYRLALALAAEYDDKVLVERFLEGALEYNCAVLADHDQLLVSAIERPCHTGDTYTFGQKYQKECEHALPAPMSDDLREEISEMTKRLYRTLGCRGVVRVDYLYHEGRLYVNEVNTIPGALSYRLFGAAGLPLGRLLSILVDNAHARPARTWHYGELLDDLVGAYK